MTKKKFTLCEKLDKKLALHEIKHNSIFRPSHREQTDFRGVNEKKELGNLFRQMGVSTAKKIPSWALISLFWLFVSTSAANFSSRDDCGDFTNCRDCVKTPGCSFCVEEDFPPLGKCINDTIYFCPSANANAAMPEECACLNLESGCQSCVENASCEWCWSTNICTGKSQSTCESTNKCASSF